MTERKLQAAAAIALGVLIAGLCGTCTFNVTLGSNDPEAGLILIPALLIGGGFTLVGLWLTVLGLRDWRKIDKAPDE